MADIQSVTAEVLRLGIEKRKKKKKKGQTTGRKYNVRMCYASYNNNDKLK